MHQHPPIAHYAVIGNPIAHSLSPFIQQQFASQTHQFMDYQKILAPKEEFATVLNDFFKQGGQGANITLPFKQEAWRLMQKCSLAANLARAVNTVLLLSDGGMFGDNTDGIGLKRDLTQNHGLQLTGKKILLLGAGGAARGVVMPLLTLQPLSITIANRTSKTAILLAEEFSAHGQVIACDFEQLPGHFDLIINATSAGLQGDLPKLPPKLFTSQTDCYDMVYGQELTPFLRYAKQMAVRKIMNGLGMLVEQAAESFYIWRGIRPETTPVLKQLRKDLS
jgi:shikimate dehydrogenase